MAEERLKLNVVWLPDFVSLTTSLEQERGMLVWLHLTQLWMRLTWGCDLVTPGWYRVEHAHRVVSGHAKSRWPTGEGSLGPQGTIPKWATVGCGLEATGQSGGELPVAMASSWAGMCS